MPKRISTVRAGPCRQKKGKKKSGWRFSKNGPCIRSRDAKQMMRLYKDKKNYNAIMDASHTQSWLAKELTKKFK